MGMIMNRFNMLQDLRNEVKANKSALFNKYHFVLSGVIVHDPSDRELSHTISNNFVRWAEITGDNFLFITFVPPTGTWRSSDYCRNAYIFDKNKLLADTTISSEVEENTIPLLRDFMDLPDEGSYLMLTDNIASCNFQRVKITADTIEEQLLQITHYCNDEAAGVIHGPKNYQQLLDTLQAHEVSMPDSLLDTLINFCSFNTSDIHFPFQLKTQLRHVSKVVQKIKIRIIGLVSNEWENRLLHMYDALSVALSSEDHALLYTSPIHVQNEDKLDHYSRKLFTTFQLLNTYICDNMHRPDKFDYSGLTLYLGKIVENELHLSICQMLRNVMGIDMPRYYNRYCPQRGKCRIPAGIQRVDINQPLQTDANINSVPGIKSIPMGNLLRAYNTMTTSPDSIDPHPDFQKILSLSPNLIAFLEKFSRECRNPASHLDIDSENTYHNAIAAFEFFMSKYFREIYHMKRMYSQPSEDGIFFDNSMDLL